MAEHSRSQEGPFGDVRHHLLAGAAMPWKVDGADIRLETSREGVILSGGRYRVRVVAQPKSLGVTCWRGKPVENRLAADADPAMLSKHLFKLHPRGGFKWKLRAQSGQRPSIDETPLSSEQMADFILGRLVSLIHEDDSK